MSGELASYVMMVEWGLIEILARDLGRDRGLVDQDWWLGVGVMKTLPGIALFLDVAPVRDHSFEVLGDILGLEESEIRWGLAWYEMMVEWGLIVGLAKDPLGLYRGSC